MISRLLCNMFGHLFKTIAYVPEARIGDNYHRAAFSVKHCTKCKHVEKVNHDKI